MNIEKLLKESGLKTTWEVKNFMEDYPFNFSTRWSDETLYSLTYTKGKSDLTNPIVREANGIILETETNRVVGYGIDVFDETDNLEAETFEYQVIPDGSFLKAYYYGDKWKIATSKTPDASYSKWSGPSFYEMFYDTVTPEFMDKLSRNFTWTFILHHPNNRIVDPDQERALYLVSGTRMDDEFEEVSAETLVEEYKLEGDVIPMKTLTENDMKKIIDSLHWSTPGLFILQKEGKRYRRTKVENPKFREILGLRGNRPNIQYRYLELLKEGGEKRVSQFLEYYPEKKEIISKTKFELDCVVRDIHSYYCRKFINRDSTNRITIPRPYLDLLFELNRKYKQDRQPTTPESIWDFILNLPLEDQAKIFQVSDQIYYPVRKGGAPITKKFRR